MKKEENLNLKANGKVRQIARMRGMDVYNAKWFEELKRRKLDTKGEKVVMIKGQDGLAGELIEVIEGRYAGMTKDQAMVGYRRTNVDVVEVEVV